MPRSFTVLIIVTMLFLGASVIALFTLMGLRASEKQSTDTDLAGTVQIERTVKAFDTNRPLAPSPLLDGAALLVPEFELVDQDGSSVDQRVFEDEVTVMAFVFTHCQLACPIITGRMFGVYQKAEGLDTQFISITVDPERDTPERLRQYAGSFGIDHARWRFLTGDYDTVERIATAGMKFAIAEDPDDNNIIQLPDGSTMRNIQHPTKLMLIGPDRSVIGIYDPYLQDDLDLLASRLRAIQRTNSRG